LFFVPQLAATIICQTYTVSFGVFFVDFVHERARAASKQENKINKEDPKDTVFWVFFVDLVSEVYIDILYPYILS